LIYGLKVGLGNRTNNHFQRDDQLTARLRELARVFVHFGHAASRAVNSNHGHDVIDCKILHIQRHC
jgi:hypothetical protein